MNFGQAIEVLKRGGQVRRAGWNGKGMLALQVPDAHSKMRRPYIYISDAQSLLVPWLASQTDMLSDDWEDVAEEEVIGRVMAGDHPFPRTHARQLGVSEARLVDVPMYRSSPGGGQ